MTSCKRQRNKLFQIGRAAASLAVAFSLLATPLYWEQNQAKAVSLSELQETQKDLEEKQKENQKKLDELKKDTAKQAEYKKTLDSQIENLQAQINGLNSQIQQLDDEIVIKNREIEEKQKSIDKNMSQLKERLCAIYMMGETSTLQMLLSSENVIDMAEKTEIIRMISEHDTKLVQAISEELTSVSKQKEEIEKNRENVAAAKTELDTKQAELTELQTEANRVLKELQGKEADAQAEQDRLDKEKAQADAAVDKWFQEQSRPENTGNSGNSENSGNSGSTGNTGYKGTGSFIWPCPGYTNITDYFGARGGSHKGLDISSYGIFGKPIVAADSGTVAFARFGMPGSGYGGYGNVVVINHGNGYMTLYAHCNSLAVSEGQTVSKGQVVGYVGNTGDSQGAHLHFEIRLNGSAQDPMRYFSR